MIFKSRGPVTCRNMLHVEDLSHDIQESRGPVTWHRRVEDLGITWHSIDWEGREWLIYKLVYHELHWKTKNRLCQSSLLQGWVISSVVLLQSVTCARSDVSQRNSPWSCQRRGSVERRSCRSLRWLAYSPTGALSTLHTGSGRWAWGSGRTHWSSTYAQVKVSLIYLKVSLSYLVYTGKDKSHLLGIYR